MNLAMGITGCTGMAAAEAAVGEECATAQVRIPATSAGAG